MIFISLILDSNLFFSILNLDWFWFISFFYSLILLFNLLMIFSLFLISFACIIPLSFNLFSKLFIMFIFYSKKISFCLISSFKLFILTSDLFLFFSNSKVLISISTCWIYCYSLNSMFISLMVLFFSLTSHSLSD